MKNNLFTWLVCLFFCFLSLKVFAQKPGGFVVFKGDTINRVDQKGMKQGVWRKYYSTDTLYTETVFKNNKVIGVTKNFYPSGKLKGSVTNDGNGKTAKAILYYESGQTMAVGRYLEQKKDSIWSYYDENNNLKSIEKYIKGKADGEWIVYYESGKVAEQKFYKNDRREGKYQQFNEDGKPILELNYNDDLEDGDIVLFHFNGMVKEKGQYLKGIKVGQWFEYDNLGNLLTTKVYANGKLIEK